MKKSAILGLIILTALSSKAQQIVPVEKTIEYMNSGNGIPENVTYLKDVNNVLNKYVGVWKGTYDNKKYEFRITKATEKLGRVTEDKLLMRYIITDANGTVIENTMALLNDNYLVIHGYYIEDNVYYLNYVGKNGRCGQEGTIHIDIVENSNNTKMRLGLQPEFVVLSTKECPNGAAAQIMPVGRLVTLTKQK